MDWRTLSCLLLLGAVVVSGVLLAGNVTQRHEWTQINRIDSQLQAERVQKILQHLKYPQLGRDDSLQVGAWSAESRVTLLWYFASWCWNCNQEIPELSKIYSQYQSSGFDILGIGVYSPVTELQQFRETYGITFPIVVGPSRTKVLDSRQHTMHYTLRKMVGDERTWGTPFHIFIVNDDSVSIFSAPGEIRSHDLRRFLDTYLY